MVAFTEPAAGLYVRDLLWVVGEDQVQGVTFYVSRKVDELIQVVATTFFKKLFTSGWSGEVSPINIGIIEIASSREFAGKLSSNCNRCSQFSGGELGGL